MISGTSVCVSTGRIFDQCCDKFGRPRVFAPNHLEDANRRRPGKRDKYCGTKPVSASFVNQSKSREEGYTLLPAEVAFLTGGNEINLRHPLP